MLDFSKSSVKQVLVEHSEKALLGFCLESEYGDVKQMKSIVTRKSFTSNSVDLSRRFTISTIVNGMFILYEIVYLFRSYVIKNKI